MINILIITFGTSNRNNMLAYSFEQLGAKVYIYDFFNYKDRKEYYKLEECTHAFLPQDTTLFFQKSEVSKKS